MQDLQTGDAEFDDLFVVQGGDEDTIRHLLNDQVRGQLKELYRLLRSNEIGVTCSGGNIIVTKSLMMSTTDMLEVFVEMTLKLYDQLRQAAVEGIDFDAEAITVQARGAVCQVCGDDIDTPPVFCRSCKTPHHQDCWEYYGACSTYGCGQKRYIRPRRVIRTKR